MARRFASFFPQRINLRVPSMRGVGQMLGLGTDIIHADLGAPALADADGILDGVSIATAVDTTTFQATYSRAVMGRYGRNVVVIASGAATSNVTVYGRDYLGQKVTESFTLNGANSVVGNKMFAYVDRITAGVTAGTTIDVGWGVRLGLPFKIKQLIAEMKNGAVAANAGAITVGPDTAATSTSADPRGYYTPASVLPDGTNTFELRYIADNSNAHGVAQYAA